MLSYVKLRFVLSVMLRSVTLGYVGLGCVSSVGSRSVLLGSVKLRQSGCESLRFVRLSLVSYVM